MMADKCLRCGKDLIEAVLPREDSTQVYLECPDHGADYVWRPCGERVPHPDEVDGSHLPILWCRYLTRVFGARIPVSPLMCADCDRPVLAAALRADAIAEIAENRARRMDGGSWERVQMRDAALEQAGRLRCDATLARDAALLALEGAKP